MTLRNYQEEAVGAAMNAFLNYKKPFIIQCAQGCLAGDTPILMPDGTTKPVRDISSGEMIMGFDNYTNTSIIYSKKSTLKKETK